MAKTKKPAQKKGGVKKAASKKVAKRAPKKLTERQADQAVADKMRAQALAAATKRLERAEAAASAAPASFARPKPTLWSRFRSAITGLFVSRKHAEANPNTTVRERVKP